VQRTEVLPRDRNLAEKEPTKFAALLIERLQKVKHDRDSVEKVMQSINQTKVCSWNNTMVKIKAAGPLWSVSVVFLSRLLRLSVDRPLSL